MHRKSLWIKHLCGWWYLDWRSVCRKLSRSGSIGWWWRYGRKSFMSVIVSRCTMVFPWTIGDGKERCVQQIYELPCKVFLQDSGWSNGGYQPENIAILRWYRIHGIYSRYRVVWCPSNMRFNSSDEGAKTLYDKNVSIERWLMSNGAFFNFPNNRKNTYR